MEAEGRWRGWQNAERYDHFVRYHAIYGWLNEALAERAELGGATRVLDLGCGTGATTASVLSRIRPDAEVLGVDASPEMIEVARANTLDPRARFVVAPAASLAEVARGPFDRVLSNAAFWQFPEGESVLAQLAERVPRGGSFTFNVPSERRPEARGSHPFQVALARAVEARTEEPFVPTARRFEPDAMAAVAASLGFEETLREELVYRGRQGELMELMSIPAMITPIAADLSPAEADRALAEARERTDPDEGVEVAWLFVRYRRV